MTREEAIQILSTRDAHGVLCGYTSGVTEALDMAIEALKEKNQNDSLVTDSSDECKEQKSKLESAADTFCRSQLITCNRVKECNGVCPFEDALQHADKTQTMDEQHTINHDREWIIGCIEHDGFIHTHRFDKANQIIHDALSAESVGLVRCKDCIRTKERDEYTGRLWCSIHRGYMEDTYYCADGLRREDGEV